MVPEPLLRRARILPFAAPLLVLLPAAAFAEAQEFGGVPIADIAARGYMEYPDASAVILLDQCHFDLDSRGELRIKHLRRIKILDEEGFAAADVRVPHMDGYKLKELKAQTYMKSGHRRKVKDVYEEHIDDRRMKVFTFPAVEPGAVLEYYTVHKAHGWWPWYFQNEYPTLHSEITITHPTMVSVDFYFQGQLGRFPERSQDVGYDPGRTFTRRLLNTKWQLDNIPGLPDEPMSPNIKDYRFGLHFALEGRTGRRWADISTGYDKLVDEFVEEKGDADGWIAEHTAESSDPLEQARALYLGIRDEIETPKPGDDMPDSLAEVLKKGVGGPWDRNLALIGLLRCIGVPARAVLIGTRDHGALDPRYSHLSQINHLLVRTEIDGRIYYLDANDRHCPFGVVDPNCRSVYGVQAVEEGGVAFALHMDDVPSARHVENRVTLGEDGRVSGEAEIRYTGYERLMLERRLSDRPVEEIAEGILSGCFGEYELLESGVREEEGDPAAKVLSLAYEAGGLAQPAGDLVLLTMPFLLVPRESPFPAPARQLPVDYGFPSEHREKVTVEFPAGCTLAERPHGSRASADDVIFRARYQEAEEQLTVDRVFRVDERLVNVDLYADLQELYTKMLASDRKHVVLRHAP